MPSHAWSTTAPTASSSFRQGMTTEIEEPAARWQVCLAGLRTSASLAAVRSLGEASSRLARRAVTLAETRGPQASSSSSRSGLVAAGARDSARPRP